MPQDITNKRVINKIGTIIALRLPGDGNKYKAYKNIGLTQNNFQPSESFIEKNLRENNNWEIAPVGITDDQNKYLESHSVPIPTTIKIDKDKVDGSPPSTMLTFKDENAYKKFKLFAISELGVDENLCEESNLSLELYPNNLQILNALIKQENDPSAKNFQKVRDIIRDLEFSENTKLLETRQKTTLYTKNSPPTVPRRIRPTRKKPSNYSPPIIPIAL